MSATLIRHGPELFHFRSVAHWTDKAQSYFRQHNTNGQETICIDRAGRVCGWGAHFMRAEREGTFPITVYAMREDPEGDAIPPGGVR